MTTFQVRFNFPTEEEILQLRSVFPTSLGSFQLRLALFNLKRIFLTSDSPTLNFSSSRFFKGEAGEFPFKLESTEQSWKVSSKVKIMAGVVTANEK